MELNQKIYGPCYCDNCKSIQPVIVYEKVDTREVKMEDYKINVSFMGSYVCNTCKHTIKETQEPRGGESE